VSQEVWILIAFFALVMALVAAAGYAFVLRPALSLDRRAAAFPDAISLPAPSLSSSGAFLAGVFRLLGEAIPTSTAEVRALRKQLGAAGYRWDSAVSVFYGVKYAAAFFLGLLAGWAAHQSLDKPEALILGLGAAVVGYRLPDRFLRMAVNSRRGRLRSALPDALDLLVMCMEAGQALDQAITEASQEIRQVHPELSSELALVHLELRAGQSRADALHNLASRNAEPELRQLVNLLIQSDRFGISTAPALRTHAKYLRIRRRQQAEEAARKISVKLVFPIFFLIFPCMLLVTLGPAVLQIFTQLLPMVSDIVD